MATVPKSFFKFCFEDFATKLVTNKHFLLYYLHVSARFSVYFLSFVVVLLQSIPAAFVECHGLHRHRQLSLHLKTQPAGGSWAVKIKKTNGVFHLTDGWSKFVKDNNLLEMKLLVFYIVGDSTLHVSIFGQDSCLELPSSSSGNFFFFFIFHFLNQYLLV